MTSHERHGISNHRQLDCLDSSYKIPAMRNWCVFFLVSLGEHLSGVGCDLMRHELKKNMHVCNMHVCGFIMLCFVLLWLCSQPVISHVWHFALLVRFASLILGQWSPRAQCRNRDKERSRFVVTPSQQKTARHLRTLLCIFRSTHSDVCVIDMIDIPEHSDQTVSIPWLLMAWRLGSPGHQQPWYWKYRVFRVSTRKDCNLPAPSAL